MDKNEFIVIRLTDSSYDYDIDGNIIYYVKKTDDLEEKLTELSQLVKTYTNFQEIEDFIFDNFEQVYPEQYNFMF